MSTIQCVSIDSLRNVIDSINSITENHNKSKTTVKLCLKKNVHVYISLNMLAQASALFPEKPQTIYDIFDESVGEMNL